MSSEHPITPVHPTGEPVNNNLDASLSDNQPIMCDTYAGLVHVEWDPHSPVTPIGKMVFFTQFLKNCNLYDKWVEDCPLHFMSPNAPKKRDILGTLLLSVLSGQTRYSHITTIRQDTVNPPLLGMTKILSEDSVRRSFQNIDSEMCRKWQQDHLRHCYEPLLEEDWILDVDTTIKHLYGHQEGAEVSYNPTKPGRPSHIIHTYAMAETRLILDCELLPGKQHPSCYSLPRLLEIIDELPQHKRPKLIRGDCAFGNDNVVSPLEERNIPYLFKIKQTKKVKDLRNLASRNEKSWTNAGQGWEGTKAKLQLTGWAKERNVVILRRASREQKKSRKHKDMQLSFPFLETVVDSSDYEYAVLITNLELEVFQIAQLYRDRSTSENHFDELKNQWGWGGFVTKDIKRSQIMARVIAQVYNWWTLFVRWVEPDRHAEAVTSRPLMLYGVAKETKHARQTTLRVTSMHGSDDGICKKMGLIASVLHKVKLYAEQLNPLVIWHRILSLIFAEFLKGKVLGGNKEAASEEELQQVVGWPPPAMLTLA